MSAHHERQQIEGGTFALVRNAERRERIRILALHGGDGFGGAPGLLTPFLDRLAEAGNVTTVAASYRTLASKGASIDDALTDAKSALDWCRAEMPKGSSLYVLGVDFGALLGLDAVLRDPAGVEGLILLNPLTTTTIGGNEAVAIALRARTDLSPQHRLAEHGAPDHLRCFIAHGGRDEIIPIGDSRDFAVLWPAARLHFETFPNSGHGFFNRAPHVDRAVALIEDFLGAPRIDRAGVPKLPEGATLLFGIGAQKAGTSWLFDYLDGHPECHCTETKELHYFDVVHSPHEATHVSARIGMLKSLCDRLSVTPDRGNLRTLERIRRTTRQLSIYSGVKGDHRPYLSYLTDGYDGQRMICEITPSYSTLDRVAFADMDSLGPAKFIFIMRDPVDRMWSQIRMAVEAMGIDPETPAFAKACAERARQLSASGRLPRLPRADYLRTMAELEAVIDPDRICYIFYEDLFRPESVSRICAFLDVSDMPARTERRVGEGRGAPMPPDVEALLFEGFSEQYRGVIDRFGDAVPERWRRERPRVKKTHRLRLGKLPRLASRRS